MRRLGFLETLAFASTLFLTLACSSRGERDVQIDDTPPAGTAVSCTATPDKNAIASGGTINVTILPSGGTAPYTINGVSGTVSTSTTVSRTPSNILTYAQLTEETFTVRDAKNVSGTCKMSVVVFPAGSTNVGDFACAIIPSNSSPKVNEPITLTPYVFDANQPDTLAYHVILDIPGGNPSGYTNVAMKRSERTPLSTTYPFVAYDGANNPQARFASMRVYQNNRFTVCSVPITVRENPSVDLAASATVAGLTDTITVTATPRGFLSSAVSYSFQTNDSGVTITQAGNTATVRVNDGRFHNPRISVTASAGGESATKFVDLSFKLLNFSCSVQGPASGALLMINQDVTINATSSAGNLEVYNLQPGYYGNIQTGSSTPIRIQYTTGGYKTVTFSLKDRASGTPCNNGAAYSVAFTVKEPLRCEAAQLASYSNTGDVLNISARAVANTGTGNIKLHSVTSDTSGLEILTSPDSLTWTGRFNQAGTYTVRVTLKDAGDNNRTAECPAFTHTAVFVNPSCSVSFVDPTIYGPDAEKPVVVAARAHNPLRLRVYATNSVIKSVNYGAPVTADSTPASLRYTQNHASQVTATVTVRNEANGAERVCSATIAIGPALACSINRTVSVAEALNTWYRKGAYETSSAASPIPVNAFNYNSGLGHAPVIAPVQMRAFNELSYTGYNIDYRLDATNGLGFGHIASPSNLVTYNPGYHVNGVYPFEGRINDSYDSIGNSCSLKDADKRFVANRLIVNTAQIVKFEMPGDATAITECRVYIKNRGNRVNTLQYYKAFSGTGMNYYWGTLDNIAVHAPNQAVDTLPYLNMEKSGRQCGISLKAMGNNLRADQVGVTELPDGGNPFEVYVKVTYHKYYYYYYTVYYQLNHL